MIEVLVLGAGGGGGFPQWNSHAPGCRRARAGDPMAASATQASVAVSGDGRHWFLLNASPDLRVQIERSPALHPQDGLRSSPICGVVLTGAEVDTVTGLLSLRERQAFSLLATAPVLARLDENPIFEVLARDVVARIAIEPGIAGPLTLTDGAPSGLRVTPFTVPGKVPLYAEGALAQPEMAREIDETIGLEITDGTSRLLFVPGCAMMTPGLRSRLEGADCVFFDATLWRDDEMIQAGLGAKSGRRMGHMSVSGPGGVIESFRDLAVRRKILIHLNNSNPLLLADSEERRIAAAAGWTVAHDGMQVTL
ncbi:pyrroloquinoline quinone biosynthesis protein PqqB [Lichenicoccus sp.]|uniref:pyrroloquinoline quinone biosynthesis protein PqqB n=1 Tax=Lichenicoccus sp. TaxID=2781899 RepID=UPI003D0A7F6F